MHVSQPTRSTRLGKTGPAVFPIGLGCTGMSGVYAASDDEESVATIRAAIDRGVTVLDTGDFCGTVTTNSLSAAASRGGETRCSLR